MQIDYRGYEVHPPAHRCPHCGTVIVLDELEEKKYYDETWYHPKPFVCPVCGKNF